MARRSVSGLYGAMMFERFELKPTAWLRPVLSEPALEGTRAVVGWSLRPKLVILLALLFTDSDFSSEVL